jgi:hypothetical protein
VDTVRAPLSVGYFEFSFLARQRHTSGHQYSTSTGVQSNDDDDDTTQYARPPALAVVGPRFVGVWKTGAIHACSAKQILQGEFHQLDTELCRRKFLVSDTEMTVMRS